MAKFGVDVTGMKEASPYTYISSGVQDNSKAIGIQATTGLIKNVGEMGIDLYKGKQIADLEADLERNVISPYMEQRENTTIAKETNLEIEGIKAGKENLFSQGADEQAHSLMEEQLNSAYARYGRAVKEGVMSPEMYESKVLVELRKAINKNPGLEKELTEQAAKVLEKSGIISIVKSDALLAKSQKDQMDAEINALYKLADHFNIPYVRGITPLNEIQTFVNNAKDDARKYETFTRAKQYKEMFTGEQAIRWVEAEGDATVRGGLSSFGKTILELGTTAEGTPANFAQIKAQAKLMATQNKDAFIQSIPVELRNNPTVLQKIEAFNKGIDTTVEVLEGLGSGEDWKKAVANHLEITKTAQDQRLRDTYDVSAISFSLEVFKANPNYFNLSNSARDSIFSLLNNLSSGNYLAPVIDKNMPKSANDVNLSRVISDSAKVGLSSGNFSGLTQVLETYNKKTPLIKDQGEKYFFLNNNLAALAKTDLTGADVDTIAQVKTMITNTLDDKSYGLSSMFTNMGKHKVVLHVTPNGHVIFKGENEDKFNKGYAISINNALEAYARVHNVSTKEAATKFYPEYLDKYVDKTTVEKPDFVKKSDQVVEGKIKRGEKQ